jgi:hypothetical protein
MKKPEIFQVVMKEGVHANSARVPSLCAQPYESASVITDTAFSPANCRCSLEALEIWVHIGGRFWKHGGPAALGAFQRLTGDRVNVYAHYLSRDKRFFGIGIASTYRHLVR